MNKYYECFKDGKIVRRLRRNRLSKNGDKRLKNYLESEGFDVAEVETEDELETGFL